MGGGDPWSPGSVTAAPPNADDKQSSSRSRLIPLPFLVPLVDSDGNELAGIRDILAKSLGTTNPINMLKATVDGLKNLRRPEDVARIRGLTISQVLPVPAVSAKTGDHDVSDPGVTLATDEAATEQPSEEK